MKRPANLAARTVIAGIALAALSLVAASPASAHTNNIFGYVEDGEGTVGFITFDRSTAAGTSLPGTSAVPDDTVGIEVTNEVGTGISLVFGRPSTFSVFNWDHTTGAPGPNTELFIVGAESVDNVSGLDTLADGTLITWVEYTVAEGEFLVNYSEIATLNRATGELTPVIDMSDLLFGDPADFNLTSLATDPISGQTFAFLGQDAPNSPAYVVLNIASGTHGIPAEFNGAGFEDGFVLGADFDADGTLFFIYANGERQLFELSSIGGPSTWPTGPRTFIGDAAANLGSGAVSPLALTVEYTAPALAATGSSFPLVWLVAGSLAIIAGGVTVMTVRRRSRTA